jgi:heme exporter protein B
MIYYLLMTQGGLDDLQVKIWNAFFWVIILFSSVNAVLRSFQSESRNTTLYYYSLYSPTDFIIAKLLYNFIYIIVIGLLSLFVFTLFLGNPIVNLPQFMLVILLGAGAYASVFTILAGIATQANNSSILTSIMGLPIVLPLIIYIAKVSREAFSADLSDNYLINLGILIAFNIILILLSCILYPYIWRE